MKTLDYLITEITKRKRKSIKGKLLSKREIECLQFIALGYCNKQIASKMFICLKTVEKHRQKVMDKLGLHNSVYLTHYALSINLVENLCQQKDQNSHK